MPTTRLTVLGDSFVEGRGDPAPLGGYRGWVPRLAERIGLRPGDIRNLGTHGATTQDVVNRQLPRALGNKAPLIGVIVGVNDLVQDYDPERFRRNMHTIFRALAGADTIVMTANYLDIPGNLAVPERFRALLRERFAQANAALRAATTASGTLCLDIAGMPVWRDATLWSEDGLHPSPAGHEHFAESMADLVAQTTGLIAA